MAMLSWRQSSRLPTRTCETIEAGSDCGRVASKPGYGFGERGRTDSETTETNQTGWATRPTSQEPKTGLRIDSTRAGSSASQSYLLHDSLTILRLVTFKCPCSVSLFLTPASVAAVLASSFMLCALAFATTPFRVTV